MKCELDCCTSFTDLEIGTRRTYAQENSDPQKCGTSLDIIFLSLLAKCMRRVLLYHVVESTGVNNEKELYEFLKYINCAGRMFVVMSAGKSPTFRTRT